MARPVGPHRVLGAGVPERVRKQRELPVVQVGRPAEQPFDPPHLLDLLRDVQVQRVERPPDHVDLVRDEVGQVVRVGFGLQKRAGVLRRRVLEKPADRHELEHPVPAAQQRPIEERARRTPVAVVERVVVRKPEVQDDGLDDRMQERAVSKPLLREPDHRFHPRRQRLGRGRPVQHQTAAGVHHRDALVGGTLRTAGSVRIGERVPRDGFVQRQHRGHRQRFVLHFADRLQRTVVVQDHPLVAGPRSAAGAQHAGGDGAGGGGAFELAGGDRLPDQRVHDEPIAGLAVHHFVPDPDPAVRPAVDPVQPLLHAVRQHERERPPAYVVQRQRVRQAEAGQPDPGPPFLTGEAGGRNEPAQLVPMEVAAVDHRTKTVREHRGQTVAMPFEQRVEGRGSGRPFHAHGFRRDGFRSRT